MAFVRQSKFRHVFGSAMKPDACFSGLKTEGTGDTNCAVSTAYFAMVKASKIFVISLEKCGRQEENNLPYIDSKSKVLDVQFSPFDDHLLASSEDTGDVNVWQIPQGGLKETMQEAFWQLHDVHTKKVTVLCWHPTAAYILATGGHDPFVTIWDCENESVLKQIHLDGLSTGLSWDWDGSRLAIAAKGKEQNLLIVDARSGDTLNEIPNCHSGTKATKVSFLKDGQRLVTVGSDRQANRSIKLWSLDSTEAPLHEMEAGNSSGVLNLYYDPDLNLLYTFAKGESVIKYYEIEGNALYFLSAYTSSVSQKGGNFLPKVGVNTQANEIARFYKLQTNKCEPIALVVPRKSEHFQKDLYPDTAFGQASLSAQDWLQGKCAGPTMVSFEEIRAQTSVNKPARQPAKRKPSSKSHGSTTHAQQPAPALDSYHGSNNNGIPEGINFAELMEDMKKVKATVRKLNKRVGRLEEYLEKAQKGDACQQEEEEEEEEEE